MPPRQPRPKPDVSITPKPKAPSEWSPRPVPTPGVGRSTADPRTPRLTELAKQAVRRASVLADATRVAPPALSARPTASGVPSALDRGLGAVNPLADAARYEAIEAARQNTTVGEKVRRRAQRATLVARGRAAGARVNDPSQGEVTRAANRLEQFSRDIELARLSKDVYRPSDKPGDAPVGWTRLSDPRHRDQLPPELRNPALWRNDATGFVAGLYKEADELGGRVVLAFRGTDDGPGVVTDAQQGIGGTTSQYKQAAQLATLARAAYGKQFVTTGHSLGGGLATQASAVAGVRGATFNPAGLHRESLRGTGSTIGAADRLVTDYHVPGEVLSAAQSATGRVGWSPVVTVARGVASSFGWMGRATSRGDYKPATLPGPVGSHVELPSVRAAEVPLLTSFLRHKSIFPIEGMELQKERDRVTIERYAGREVGAS